MLSWAGLAGLVGLCGLVSPSASAASPTLRGGGGVVEVPPASSAAPLLGHRYAYSFRTGDLGNLRVDAYSPRMFRVRWSPSDVVDRPSIALRKSPHSSWPFACALVETPESYIVRTAEAEVRVSRSGLLRVDFWDLRSGEPVSLGEGMYYDGSYRPEDDQSYLTSPRQLGLPSGYRIREARNAPLGECYLGLGDWGGPLNRRGSTLQFWNEDAWGWRERRNPKYTTLPVYHAVSPMHNSHRYSLFLHSPSRSLFDMASTSPDTLWFQVSSGDMDYFMVVGGGVSLAGAMRELSWLTGPTALLPKWAYGYHMSKFTYSQSEIEEMVTEHRARRIPLSAVFIDLDYMDQGPSISDTEWFLVQFKWGPAYPRPKDLTAMLRNDGIGSVVMVEPFLTDEDPKFSVAESNGWFVRNPDGTPCLVDLWCAERAGWVDYTSPSASAWWRSELASFVGEYGLWGVWNDLNETADKGRIPLGALYDMGETGGSRTARRASPPPPPHRLHQWAKALYALYNARTSYEAQRVVYPSHRPYVLSRGAFPGLQRWAASWSGDNLSNPDHLRCNIRVGTSVGISGLSNYGHDVGGFSGNPSPEVMERWQEWAVFSPSMRNHYSKQSPAREIYRFRQDSAGRLAGTVLQRYYLLPTLYSLARAAAETGWPLNAPVPAVFPSDPVTYYANENDIMLGRSILAAPVVEPGETTRLVYLPAVEGGWFSLWEESRYGSGWHSVPAPLGRSPAFVRAGGFMAVDPRPMSAARPWGREVLEWKNIEVHAWPGAGGHFWVYDDDGMTGLDYPDPARMSVRVSGIKAGDRWVLSLASDAPLGERTLDLVLRGLGAQPSSVRVDGEEVPVSDGSVARVSLASRDRPLSVVVEVDGVSMVPSADGQPARPKAPPPSLESD